LQQFHGKDQVANFATHDSFSVENSAAGFDSLAHLSKGRKEKERVEERTREGGKGKGSILERFKRFPMA
jgi:hypothetical protein